MELTNLRCLLLTVYDNSRKLKTHFWCTLIPGCTDGAALYKHLPESAETKHEDEKAQNGQRKYKHKKEIHLPRRASKRLAGIKVDPVPELKTSN